MLQKNVIFKKKSRQISVGIGPNGNSESNKEFGLKAVKNMI